MAVMRARRARYAGERESVWVERCHFHADAAAAVAIMLMRDVLPSLIYRAAHFSSSFIFFMPPLSLVVLMPLFFSLPPLHATHHCFSFIERHYMKAGEKILI